MKKTKGQKKLQQAIWENKTSVLAEKLGISQRNIYYLNGDNMKPEEMKLRVARALKNVLGIEYDDWFEEVESKK